MQLFRGAISGTQVFKNVTAAASTVVGGASGWLSGATVGATLGSSFPIVGTTIGWFIVVH